MIAIRFTAWITASIALAWLTACAGTTELEAELVTGALPPPSDERPQDEPVALGRFHYAKSDYGLAERHFRAAVEANPASSEGWLGLAASYDRLRRFELAERAYKQVLAREGRTVPALNNLAYHHMLRGNLRQARKLLDEAVLKEPTNPFVLGNLRLLETWKTGADGERL